MSSWFRRYLLPGFVFQSIIIAGGYGTGRELVEFFLQYGPMGGLLGMTLPSTLLASATCMIAFELARQTQAYDYRSFLQQLLGRAWFVYEIGYMSTVLLILAVIGAATGSLFVETFGIPAEVGAVGLLVAIAFLAFEGTRVIEGFLSMWSLVLYGVYSLVFVSSMVAFGPAIADSLASSSGKAGWLLSGFRYGALQLSLVPAILFATTHITTRKEAFVAGALAGPIAMIPAVLFYVAMLGHYPAILQEQIPASYVLQELGSPFLRICFQLVLIGTFLETGTGLIHAFNERVARVFAGMGRVMPSFVRPLTAVALIAGASLLSRFGLIDLIAVGYSALAWAFIGILIVPLATVGVWKVLRRGSAEPE